MGRGTGFGKSGTRHISLARVTSKLQWWLLQIYTTHRIFSDDITGMGFEGGAPPAWRGTNWTAGHIMWMILLPELEQVRYT
jgi:hypothetical protein